MTLSTLYAASGVVLACVALAVVAWALFGNRARGRERCPGCWYDLSGVGESGAGADGFAPVTCPECGRRVAKRRQMHRTRRRWRVALAATPLFVVAYELARVPDIVSRGWIGAVPTTALVFAVSPSRLDPFNKQLVSDALVDELIDERFPDSFRWQRALLTGRLARYARRGGIDVIPERTRGHDRVLGETVVTMPGTRMDVEQLLRMIDALTGIPVLRPRQGGLWHPHFFHTRINLDGAAAGRWTARDLLLVLFPRGRATPFPHNKSTLDVRLTPAGVTLPRYRYGWGKDPWAGKAVRFYDLRRHLRAVRSRFDPPPARDRDARIFDGGGSSSGSPGASVGDIVEAIEEFVDLASWRDAGGYAGSVYTYDERTLIIEHYPCIHIEIERLLEQILSPVGIGEDAVAAVADIHPLARRTVVYDLGELIEARFGAGERTERNFWGLVDRMTVEVDREGWRSNGGNTSFVGILGPLVVVDAPGRVHGEVVEWFNGQLVEP